MSKVPFNNLELQWREIEHEVRAELTELFGNSDFSDGRYVRAFESDMAGWLRTSNAIAVNSGTSALHLAVLAAGIGPGDEVLVPAHTFIATVWCVLYAGATPVLCDVEDGTGNIDPNDAERRVTARTRAVIPVHLYGQPANIDAIVALAASHNLRIIEDNAQSIGAKWNQRMLGTHGHFGCFSFYPGKNLGGAGEAGMIVTDDDMSAALLRRLRNHGQSERYVHSDIGFNYRMDGIQGIILRQKLHRLAGWTERRRQLAQRYANALADLPLRLPQIYNQDHVWHLYVVRSPERSALRDFLADRGIETGLHYPLPLHRQPCLAHLRFDRAGYPVAEDWANQSLSLPLYYGMRDDEVDYAANEIRAFFGVA